MWPFSRKGASGFNWHSTAEEVTQGLDGSGLTAIVTGASSGIGTETSRVLAMRGVHVVMAVRNVSAGNNVKDSIVQEIPDAKLSVMELDLASMASVRKFSSEFSALNLPLNILINNAGIAATPFSLSQDGIELQFATNYIGHFLLTHLLLENMKETARKSKIEGKIINVSSEVHRLLTYREGIRFDKINDRSEYSSWRAYGQSKLASILHSNELCRHFKEEEVEITANSLHPGTITTNNLRYQSFVRFICHTLGRLLVKNVQQGAATTCYIALHPQAKGVTGKYFCDCNVVEPSAKAKDTELAKKLWDFSINLISK